MNKNLSEYKNHNYHLLLISVISACQLYLSSSVELTEGAVTISLGRLFHTFVGHSKNMFWDQNGGNAKLHLMNSLWYETVIKSEY